MGQSVQERRSEKEEDKSEKDRGCNIGQHVQVWSAEGMTAASMYKRRMQRAG